MFSPILALILLLPSQHQSPRQIHVDSPGVYNVDQPPEVLLKSTVSPFNYTLIPTVTVATPIPTEIKVGVYTYKVIVTPGPITACPHLPSEMVFGCTKFLASTIELLAAMPPNQMRACLIHEITHTLADYVGARGDNYDDEDWAHMISPSWLMVLRDNPQLVRYLTEP